MNRNNIFLITIIDRLEEHPDYKYLKKGQRRTVGYAFSYEDAERILNEKAEALNEKVYNFAFIEELPMGISPKPSGHRFYAYSYCKGIYEAIASPDFIRESDSIGPVR